MSRLLKELIHPSTRFRHGEAMDHPQEPKLVVAHFMVGNTAPYTPYDWEQDIKLASKHGIDGFALNIGREQWQFEQVSVAFEVAERSDTDFNFFISFDMSSLGSSGSQDICLLKRYILKFANHSHYLRYNGKALVSTFAGEGALFGCPDCKSGWLLVKDTLEEVCPIFFMPSFFMDLRRFRSMRCLDGAFNWNGCWPTQLTPESPPDEIQHPRLLSDAEYLQELSRSDGHRKAYMASVSPWFFTHYGEDSWNKNWIYLADDWLLARRWQQLISMRDDINIVQIISWNDYGESHYIGPIKGAQPNSEAWVNGFDHTAWLHLCGYFARLFKAGRGLAGGLIDIREDHIYVWARPHPRDAEAHEDPVGRPRNWKLTEDVFWVVIIASSPAHVTLRSMCTHERHPSPSPYSNVPASSEPMSVKRKIPAGLSMLSCPLVPGGGIYVQLIRKDEVVIDFHPHDFIFEPCPKTYNFNAYTAMYPPTIA